MNALEDEISKLFSEMGLVYYNRHDQVEVSRIHPPSPAGEHLEFDGVALIGRTCLLVEITSQAQRNREKIRRFVRHANLFRRADLPLRDKLGLLTGIPRARLAAFEDVNDWRYLYIGTSPELREHRLRPQSFGESEAKLGILWDEEWEYLRILTKNIGPFARGELLASVDIPPPHDGEPSEIDLNKPFIRLERRKLARGMPKADIYLAEFSPAELLTMCRVFRYQNLPMAIESGTGDAEATGYQRLLIRDKLASLREYIGNDASVAFPNTITLISSTCQVHNTPGGHRLKIPYRYASLDLIDGQHRLYAYADRAITDTVRKNARLCAAVIKFDETNALRVNRYAATLFVTINRHQAKVKTELIFLTAYDAMGEDSGTAIAGKALATCAARQNGSLTGLLRVRPLVRPTRGARRPLPIVTIVNELAPLLDWKALQEMPANRRAHFLGLVNSNVSQARQKKERLRFGVGLLERYFRLIRDYFREDFDSTDSSLFSAKYFAAFLKLFRQSFLEETRSWDEIGAQLERIRTNGINRTRTALAFPRGHRRVPGTKGSVEDILHWLEGCR